MGVSLLLVFLPGPARSLGLGSTAQVIGHVTFSISFVVVIVRGRLFSIGREYEEAAADLGASPHDQLLRVLLPLLAPAIVAARRRRVRDLARRLRRHPVPVRRRDHDDRLDADLLSDARRADSRPERARNDHAAVNPRSRSRLGSYLALLPAEIVDGSDGGSRRHDRRGGIGDRWQRRDRLEQADEAVRRGDRGRRHRSPDAGRRVLLAARAVRLRQDDDAADDRRLRAADARARSSSTTSTWPQVPPHKRNVNTVFQSYALFPHLDVARQRRLRAEVQAADEGRASRRGSAEALELVQLGDYAKRKPSQLSGGQQQRVALARALVLTAAGAAPRRAARRARREAAQGPAGRAEDAPARARDHVRLRHARPGGGADDERPGRGDERRPRRAGRARRGRSTRSPETLFVADFLGVSNLIDADASPDGDACALRVGERTLRGTAGATGARGEVKAMIRPERVVRRGAGSARGEPAARAWSSGPSTSARPTSCMSASSAAACSRRRSETTGRPSPTRRARP